MEARGSRDGGKTVAFIPQHRLGTSDDFQDADGSAILNYSQAQKKGLGSGGAQSNGGSKVTIRRPAPSQFPMPLMNT